MATTISWTGYSPTMGASGANVASLAGSLVDGESGVAKKLAKLVIKPQLRPLRALLRVLNGNNVGAGGNAVSNRSRVQALVALNTPLINGGLVPIETVPLLGATVAGRVTATADQTRWNSILDEINAPSSYPTELSGNGGGGKLGR